MNSDSLCCDRIYKGNEKGASCALFLSARLLAPLLTFRPLKPAAGAFADARGGVSLLFL